MKKKILSFFSLLLLPVLLGSYVFLYENGNINEPEIYREVRKVAESGMWDFLKQIPVGFETKYGFSSRAEVTNSSIGNIYEVYTITPEFLEFPNIDMKSFVKPEGYFRVEVTCNNEVKTFLTVDKINGNYKVVDIGGDRLARELDNIIKYSNDKSNRRIIFRMYQLKCDFLATSENSQNIRFGGSEIESFNFYSTVSSRNTFSRLKDNIKKYSFTEISPMIKDKYSVKIDKEAGK